MTQKIPLFINGEFVTSESSQSIPVINPATQEQLAELPFASEREMTAAVEGAKAAFKTWRKVPVSERARLMMRYCALLKEHHDELGELISKDMGKTFADAKGDVWRGIEVVEQAANIPSSMMGETVENVASNIDTYSYHQPLGVCVGIAPFNFPAMIPLWMFPLSIAAGNTFILKPSEQVPLTVMRMVELFEEAGAPKGVLQIVHGGKEQVDFLLKHPDTKAVSFVGSVPVGEYIYKTATENMKRAQCMAGAKNHMVIMPDADKGRVLNGLVGAAVGAAGQRCMAISVAVFVGDSKEWINELKDQFSLVRPGAWDDPEAGYGPVISVPAKERILGLIAKGKEEANCLLDGSDCTVEGLPDGNWIGPTLFTDVTTDMTIYKEEIFGPVLCCITVDTLADALEVVNSSPYGNGTSIYTSSGAAARKYQYEVEVGQVGVNVPIPVPLPFFSFTGWKGSFMGDLHAYGKQAVRFYTETKTITSRWNYDEEAILLDGQPNLTINLK
ncbi:CoA-acylating methylmalonate-semialdehyde dehydrogenase [uncultured Endozoicomonas sp.]|uniref:CoA-acylating methylmalonate-semialdehyde dehydrogenase n=1 Tax=uncultured Endozoicomonas sp. TaxID=432652 RepID=UPI002634405D|nr:CoA-acylating methylmalonate-semialdehyde dehydrogenase [uncultured Endozoicomonas sp.]